MTFIIINCTVHVKLMTSIIFFTVNVELVVRVDFSYTYGIDGIIP